MKTLIFAVLLAALSFAPAAAQMRVKQDKNGNFVQVSGSSACVPATDTGKTFTTSKGEVFKVWKSSKGRFFVLRTSKKSGKEYKQYLN